jgi:large subunit ribosomal protein L17
LAMMRNLVTSLLRHERIKTTDPKAKEVRRWADRMIGLGKEGTLHARRRALGFIRDRAVVRKVFDTLATRFKERNGGYTRIVKIGWRRGDRAPISVIELLAEQTPQAESPSGSKGGRRRSRRKAAGSDKEAAQAG